MLRSVNFWAPAADDLPFEVRISSSRQYLKPDKSSRRSGTRKRAMLEP